METNGAVVYSTRVRLTVRCPKLANFYYEHYPSKIACAINVASRKLTQS